MPLGLFTQWMCFYLNYADTKMLTDPHAELQGTHLLEHTMGL